MSIYGGIMPGLLRHRVANLRQRCRLRGEGGFTLIELAVASGVMATALAMLAGVLTSGLSATGYARERQMASQLANQAVEQTRALPFTALKNGLSTADPGLSPAADPNITTCGTAYCFGGEPLATHPADPINDKAPLVPH